MPENVAPRSGPPAGAASGRGKSAYQDRDKPAQIRFSNISAAKGTASRPEPRPSHALSPGCWVGMGFSVSSNDSLWASRSVSSVQRIFSVLNP